MKTYLFLCLLLPSVIPSICQNTENCAESFDCLSIATNYENSDYYSRTIKYDTLCKVITLDTCFWKAIEYNNKMKPNYSGKSLFQFQSADSIYSIHISMEKSLSDYPSLHKEITGKKFKKGDERVPVLRIYEHGLARFLKQQNFYPTAPYNQESPSNVKSETTYGFNIDTKREIAEYKLISYSEEESHEIYGIMKINNNGGYAFSILFKEMGAHLDQLETLKIREEIKSWFDLEDDFNCVTEP